MDITSLKQGILSGNRKALSRAITIIESETPYHRRLTTELLSGLEQNNTDNKCIRLGITGPPGVGKSTFIETFGLFLIEKDLSVAVIAVDPSSKKSGGSILGDKLRMHKLSTKEKAFIRPAASGNNLGGINTATLNIITLLEYAGFDVILVETVGVGQSETNVYDITDMFIHLYNPVSGDEMQGIKRGIMELSDLFLITKSDGNLLEDSMITEKKLIIALSFLRTTYPDWKPPIIRTSAQTSMGYNKTWASIEKFFQSEQRKKSAITRRKETRKKQITEHLSSSILAKLLKEFSQTNNFDTIIEQLSAGAFTEEEIVNVILDEFAKNHYTHGQATK